MKIKISYENNTIMKNGKPATDEEIHEFEEEVLCKKISDASEMEINNAIKNLENELIQWIKHKNAWTHWKKWAENQ